MDIRAFAPLETLLIGLVPDQAALRSPQCRCLTNYLTEIGARSVVIEDDYFDDGYLADYVMYYARCHDELPRWTRRLHFFQLLPGELRSLTDEALKRPGDDVSEALMNREYLGFLVLRPLPRTIIGRTCLRTYAKENPGTGRKRHFPILRHYEVMLHGLRLNVQSVAFQEQDNEIAACSTTAIWYALHALPKKFTEAEISSTYTITDVASQAYVKRSLGEIARRFPTSGLGLEQIESYLRSVGMDCIVCGAVLNRASRQVAKYLAAYASAGYPMLLIGNLYVSERNGVGHTKLGLHTMTALGYSFTEDFMAGDRADRIQRVFAHDDNLGPFASYELCVCEAGDFAEFLSERAHPEAANDSTTDAVVRSLSRLTLRDATRNTSIESRITGYLASTSRSSAGGALYRKFTPEYFIIPVNPEIRLPYEGIALFAEQVANVFNSRAHQWFAPGERPPEISWAITLCDAAEFKAELRRCSTADRESVVEVLLRTSPKHLWVVGFSTNDSEALSSPMVDFYFDATALKQQGGFLGQLPYDVPDAENFMSVVSACLVKYDDKKLAAMDPDLQCIIRSVKNVLLGGAVMDEVRRA